MQRNSTSNPQRQELSNFERRIVMGGQLQILFARYVSGIPIDAADFIRLARYADTDKWEAA